MNQNTFITTEYRMASKRLPKGFDGFRIAVLADLHDCRIGGDFGILLSKLEQLKPDLILLAGDMITETGRGKDHVHAEQARRLIRGLVRLAPVYYGIGNHEMRWQHWTGEEILPFSCWEEEMRDLGVVWLDNTHKILTRRGDVIRVTGLNLPAPYFSKCHPETLTPEGMEELVGASDPGIWQILLAHTPYYGEVYGEWGADLAIAGHYHGGVIRLPGIGGLISTSFRLFPRYDHGRYAIPGGQMVVSAGLGCHTIPVRVNNPPELVMLTLCCEEAGSDDSDRI